MNIDLTGMRVMITGAASGIGACTARTFRELGARVCICDSSEEVVATFCASNRDIFGMVADVTNPDAVRSFFDESQRQLGGLDAFVNNAGYSGPAAAIENLPSSEVERIFAVNVKAQFLCLAHAVPLIRKAGGGSIVNLSSAAGRLGYPLRSAYAAAKWAVIGLTQSLAMELGKDQIRVNAILPGSVDGERMKRVIEDRARTTGRPIEVIAKQEAASMSLGSLIPPQQIANMIVFICSEAGRFVSGQSLGVDGNYECLRDFPAGTPSK